MFFKKNKPAPIKTERYLWVARMPSIRSGKLPATTPKPVVIDRNEMHKGHLLFFKHCDSQKAEHLILNLMTPHEPVDIKKSTSELHRSLWLYTSPRRFMKMGWGEYLSRSDTLERSKTIALGLKGLWDSNHPDVLQAIHWYSSIRGNLERLISRKLPVTMCNDEKWSKSKQQAIFNDPIQPLYPPKGVYRSDLSEKIPLPLRQLIQDTWVTIQQLTFNSTSLKKLETINDHMRSIYRLMIVNNFKPQKAKKHDIYRIIEGEFIPFGDNPSQVVTHCDKRGNIECNPPLLSENVKTYKKIELII